jgi:hypothetical protein
MAMRAWRVWGVSAVLAGGVTAAAKPPELPTRPEVDGKSTPSVTQDYYQPEPAPPPRVLPAPVLDPTPRHGPESAGGVITAGLRAVTEQPGSPAWKARAALDVAELHFRSCDAAEARLWYEEVIKLAPNSDYAAFAADRLNQTEILPAGGQSREPPLAGRIP